jgi:hypothetical protein
MNLRAVVTALFVFGAAATHATAAPFLTVYTDRAAWEVAVSGAYVEKDFDTFNATVSYEFAPVNVGDFTVSVSGETFGTDFHSIGPTGLNTVNGTPHLSAATGPTGGTTLSFSFPIWSFGADWAGTSNGGRVTSINIDGTILALPNLEEGLFYGFTSDTPFTSMFMYLTDGDPDGFGMDNVVYTRSAVPEPVTLALMGLGMAALALRRRNGSSM